MEARRSISLREVYELSGEKMSDIKTLGKDHIEPVARLIGQVSRIGTYKSRYGDGLCLIGMFEATNPKTGEIIRAPKCYPPEFIIEQMESAVASAPKDAPVQFALDIGAQVDESAVGYKYVVSTLLETRVEDDPLQALKNSIPEKALPKPDKKK